jgi:hypothetical protein
MIGHLDWALTPYPTLGPRGYIADKCRLWRLVASSLTPYYSSSPIDPPLVAFITFNLSRSPSSAPPRPAMAASRSALSALRLSARVCARPVFARSFQSARILRQGKAQRRGSC